MLDNGNLKVCHLPFSQFIKNIIIIFLWPIFLCADVAYLLLSVFLFIVEEYMVVTTMLSFGRHSQISGVFLSHWFQLFIVFIAYGAIGA